MTFRESWSVLKQTATEFSQDKATQLGASLAFYSILSLSPLLIIALTIAAAFFGEQAARGELVSQMEALVGTEGASVIEDVLANAQKPGAGTLAGVLGIVTLLFGASGVFGQLQAALNTAWDVKPKEGRGVWGVVRDRLVSFAIVLGTGFLLLVSLVASTILAGASRYFAESLPGAEIVWSVLNFCVSFAIIAGLFAMIFKYVPDVKMTWRDVGIGAAITALLFMIGNVALGIYLGMQSVGSAFGAAGSLVVLIVWIYYSALILLLGAEFTQVYAQRFGSHVRPSDSAEWADQKHPLADRREAPPRVQKAG